MDVPFSETILAMSIDEAVWQRMIVQCRYKKTTIQSYKTQDNNTLYRNERILCRSSRISGNQIHMFALNNISTYFVITAVKILYSSGWRLFFRALSHKGRVLYSICPGVTDVLYSLIKINDRLTDTAAVQISPHIQGNIPGLGHRQAGESLHDHYWPGARQTHKQRTGQHSG